MRLLSISFIVIIAACSILAEDALSCSVCRCGDGLFCTLDHASNSTGENPTGVLQSRQIRVSLQNQLLSKSNALEPEGLPEEALKVRSASHSEEEGTERERTVRTALRLGYGLSSHLAFNLELPLAFRRLTADSHEGMERQNTSGFGDAEVSGIWTADIDRTQRCAYTIGLAAALKVPTGKNKLERDGERMDEHMQPGTGSTDWQVGAAFSRTARTYSIFTSLYARKTGSNDYEYKYGNAFLFNAGVLTQVVSRVSLMGQINGRYAARDLDHQQDVENTGGWVVYLSPGLRFSLGAGVSFLSNLQIPIHEDLYGIQKEKLTWTTSLSASFGR